MLAETPAGVEIGTYITTLVVGGLTALLTFAAVVGSWYTMSAKLDAIVKRADQSEELMAELVEAIKGKGLATGLVSAVQALEKTSEHHERQFNLVFRKIGGGPNSGSGVRPAIGDSGE